MLSPGTTLTPASFHLVVPELFRGRHGSLEAVCERSAALYGDKSPNYFDSMQALAREFPNAHFIVIWRDLADTCRSIVSAGRGSSFFAKRGMSHRALIGYRKMKRECDALARRGVPLHQIQYEEMVQSPECSHAGHLLVLTASFRPAHGVTRRCRPLGDL